MMQRDHVVVLTLLTGVLWWGNVASIAQTQAKGDRAEPNVEADTPVAAVKQKNIIGRIESVALAEQHGPSSGPMFQRLAAQRTGIDFVGQYPTNTDYEIQLLPTSFAGGGVCVGDYDGDGLSDIYLTNQTTGNRLYRNLGNWRFQNVTEYAGVGAAGRWSTGATQRREPFGLVGCCNLRFSSN